MEKARETEKAREMKETKQEEEVTIRKERKAVRFAAYSRRFESGEKEV